MQVSRGRPHMLTSNQRGRGKEPVVVLGRIRSLVAVNMVSPNRHFMPGHFVSDFCGARRPGVFIDQVRARGVPRGSDNYSPIWMRFNSGMRTPGAERKLAAQGRSPAPPGRVQVIRGYAGGHESTAFS